jgi:hypothetical protein
MDVNGSAQQQSTPKTHDFATPTPQSSHGFVMKPIPVISGKT